MVGAGQRGENTGMIAIKVLKDFRGHIPSVLSMSKKFHHEAGEVGPWNEALVASFLAGVCDNGRAAMFVAVDGFGNRAGFLVAQAFPNYLTGEVIAEETAIYVDENYRKEGVGDKLLDEFERWAKEEGRAARIRVTAQASLRMAGVVRWFESRGYRKAEISLTKEVQN